jgi:hypothetical protein
MQEGIEKPRPKVLYEVGELVRIKEARYTDFNGNVGGSQLRKSKVRVSDHLRTRYPGRARIRPGRKSLRMQQAPMPGASSLRNRHASTEEPAAGQSLARRR